MSWHVGQEVVVVASWATILKDTLDCIRRYGRRPTLIRPNRVYRVIRVTIVSNAPYLSISGTSGWRYPADYFRPVVKFKNDISELQAILDRINQREVVDA